MNFVNERISPEDFNKYDIGAIIKKIKGINSRAITTDDILSWTIDRSKNLFLLYITSSGQFEGRHVETYVLWWDGTVIRVDLETVDGSRSDRNSTSMILKLDRLVVPDGFAIERQKVLDVLKEARTCRGSYGSQKNNYTIEFQF